MIERIIIHQRQAAEFAAKQSKAVAALAELVANQCEAVTEKEKSIPLSTMTTVKLHKLMKEHAIKFDELPVPHPDTEPVRTFPAFSWSTANENHQSEEYTNYLSVHLDTPIGKVSGTR